MCGVIGLIYEHERGDLGVVAGELLRTLEYRGYDSTGAAIHRYAASANMTRSFVNQDGGLYALNNDRGRGQGGLFRFVSICGPGQDNEVTISAPFVPIGGTLDLRVRTAQPRLTVTLLSDTTIFTRAVPGLAGRGMFDGSAPLNQVVSIANTAAGVPLDVPVAVPPLAALVGFQLTFQSLCGPVGGSLNSLSGPALAVLGPQ